MTQVQEVSKKGLNREFTVTVPNAELQAKITAKLEEIGKQAKLPGFRPGKAPLNIIKQHYGSNARAEVLDEAVSNATEKTLTERNLRPATQPKIELVTFAEDKDLEFKLAVEILPEIKAADFSKITLERFTSEVDEKTIEEAITRGAKTMREPEAISEKRGAKMGDVVVIDFDGSVDGKSRDGMKGEGHNLELGSKSFIDNFEDQLVGSKVGDKKTIKVTFPEAYHAADLAGKKAEFAVDVKEIRAHKPIEINDELAKELGFDSLEKLRERVKTDMGGDYERITRALIKRQLMDKLADSHKFEVPPGMLENEFNNIWEQIEAAKKRGDLSPEDKKKSDDQLKKDYREIAERRIRLGLLLADVAEKQKIGVAPTDLRNALMAEARRFPGQEQAVIDYYTKTQGALERLRAPLLEEKVIDYILSQAKITDKQISADELVKMPQEMD